MWSVIGILAALRRRETTGEGCEVDTSLFETALAWMTVPTALYLASGRPQGRTGSEAAMLVPYKAFAAADGYLVIAAGNDKLFARLCAVLGRPEWVEDARFRSNPDRVANRVELNALIDAAVAKEPRDSWISRLEAAGVPCAPLQSVDQVAAHPQTRALEMIQPGPDGSMSLMGLPLSFDGKRPPFRKLPPRLGEDGEGVARLFPVAANKG
jgi:crotonobetainyl-CoA:carnitine CoA-transferase CaiB-like acyl-CoA transferase